MLLSRFIKSAVALLLLAISFIAPVHAQQNKQIISGTWYEDRAEGTASFSLSLTFAQTPANQFLNITNIACNVTVSSNQVISAVTLYAGTTSGGDDLGRYYEVKGNVTPETSGSQKFYSIVTNQIFYKFGPGRYPTIEIDTATTGSILASCTIVGNLTAN